MNTVENELKHYGILGMKWGVYRRASKTAAVSSAKKEAKLADREFRKATNNNKSQDKIDAAKNKANAANQKYKDAYAKAKANEEKNLYKKGYDKEAAARMAKMSASEAIAQSFLLGSYGSLKYNEAKSRGDSTGMARAKSLVKGTLNNLTFGTAGTAQRLARKHTAKVADKKAASQK